MLQTRVSLLALFAVAACVPLFFFMGPRTRSVGESEDPEAYTRRTLGGSGPFAVGAGMYDITGPAADVNLMGYANMNQKAGGIHLRLWARAFVIADPESGKRVAFVSMDAGMSSDIITARVVTELNKRFPKMYSAENVAISGTHTHSGQAGFLQYTLFQVTSLGYVQQTADAFVNGIVEAVAIAHNSLRPATIDMVKGVVENASINRSPTSYLRNPESERSRYNANTDNEMLQLRFDGMDRTPVGLLNWFAVHGTSMNNTNSLISGDNKGYAGYISERIHNNGARPGRGKFVSAFAQTNLGDVSPNTRGPHCQDTGLPCDVQTSTCNGKNELCVASGPGKDMVESTQIIGKHQVDESERLYNTAGTKLARGVDYIHQYVHMPSLVTRNGDKLCSAAMGDAFAAGTTDGPGAFDFKQGTTSPNVFWNAIAHILAKPSAETEACQAPKSILLDTGDMTFPYGWDPETVPVQIFKVGTLYILSVPGEFTTMSGRRLREAVKTALDNKKQCASASEGCTVVIAGLTNSYASYIATYEEYQNQRYEGGSTLFGPHTLEGYITKFVELAEAMADGRDVTPGTPPPSDETKMKSLLTPVVVDTAGLIHNFGDVTVAPKASYSRGETVAVTFRSGCPRNNLRTMDTFLTVERKMTDGSWHIVAVDADWETQFHWYRQSALATDSYADIKWTIPADAEAGEYRIRHLGNHRNILGSVSEFQGASPAFQVTA